MQRLRLKADGRIVELRDGREFPLAPSMSFAAPAASSVAPATTRVALAMTTVTPEMATSPVVPVETIRNWEQGKRMPRGPARALLAVIAHAPETVFAALARP
jgi:putative transcriptional regulator